MPDNEARVQCTDAEAALADEHKSHEMLQLGVMLLCVTATEETAAHMSSRTPHRLDACYHTKITAPIFYSQRIEVSFK